MGRFEFVPGVDKEGSPVFRQAHSRKVPTDYDFLLYRWGKPLFFSSSADLAMSGVLG